MSRFYASIFNDVLAPITQGPSSANTAGPYRIGRIARQLIDGKLEYIRFNMSTKGGFVDTFFGMGSDKGLLLGLFEKDLLTFPMDEIYNFVESTGVKYEFNYVDDIPGIPTEMGILTLRTETDEITLRGISMGGGEILIDEFNGENVSITGRFDEVFKGHHLKSVYPLDVKKEPIVPFSTSNEMLSYAIKSGKTLSEVAIDYEMALTGESRENIIKLCEKVIEVSYNTMDKGYEGNFTIDGLINKPSAKIMQEKIKTEKLLPIGLGLEGAIDAIATMEYSNAHGIIVCMPTGGAAGIIPAGIRRTVKELNLTHEDEIKAFLVAGLIGSFYYPTHYHGSIGCQAEVGIATSMVSAALCSLITDDVKKIEKASVLAMQYIIGQVCDPVLGFVQVPCIMRNATSISVAAMSANLAILDMPTLVSLDGMVDATVRVGDAIKKYKINDMGTCGSYCKNCTK